MHSDQNARRRRRPPAGTCARGGPASRRGVPARAASRARALALALALAVGVSLAGCAARTVVREEQRIAPVETVLGAGVRVHVDVAPELAQQWRPEQVARARDALRAALRRALDRHGVPRGEAGGELEARILRWRDRSGGSAGSERPASVAFALALRDAADGLVYSARVDDSQAAFSDDPLTAVGYPGGGMRWLDVDTFAGWLAQRAVDALFGRADGAR